jgi:hypothetical protein
MNDILWQSDLPGLLPVNAIDREFAGAMSGAYPLAGT